MAQFFERLRLSSVFALITITLISSSSRAATETVLHEFIPFARGYKPVSSLVPDSQGNFYGTTYEGGVYGFGTVYQLTPAANGSWTETVLHSFAGGSDGIWPTGNVVVDSAGNVYGVTSNGGSTHFGLVYKLSPSSNGWTETILHTFTGAPDDGTGPVGGLSIDDSGNLYGDAYGIIFELSQSSGGWTEAIIHKFSGQLPDCATSEGVVRDAAGNLYGVSRSNYYAANGSERTATSQPKNGIPCAEIFQLSPQSDGRWNFTKVRACLEDCPSSNLAIDAQQNIYGVSVNSNQVFKLEHGSGGDWGWKVLADLQPAGYPFAGVILDSAGNLFGATEEGGDFCGVDWSCGTIFKLTPHQGGNWTETTLYEFTGGSDGQLPLSPLYVNKSGKIFGTTSLGGTSNAGTIFELSESTTGTWSETQMFVFPSTDGNYASSGLLADGAGNFYGTTSQGGVNQCNNGGFIGCGTVFKMSKNSEGQWQEAVIYNFTGANGDGNGPSGELVVDSLGNLYGVTFSGGTAGEGTVYELSPNSSGGWTETVLYSFSPAGSKNDGFNPVGGLLLDSSGNLYGVTEFGGGSYNGGTAYMLIPSENGVWKETIIFSFGYHIAGEYPLAGLTIDAKGNLYGTLSQSGSGDGLVFELSPVAVGTWTQTTLHLFTGFGHSDGAYPAASLIFDSAGNLYGTTVGGGTTNCNCGTAFELSPTSRGPWKETLLHSFSNTNDAYYPEGGLSFDAIGDLYGAANSETGVNAVCGAVFELTPNSGGSWTESVPYTFTGFPSDGCYPSGNLILDSAGNIFGTTSTGGIEGQVYEGGGTVFEITP